MKHGIYSIHDTRTEEYSLPFFQPTNVHALRVFTTAVRDENKDNALHNYPKDFILYKVGEWDTEEGTILTIQHEHITTAEAVLKETINAN